MNTKYRKMMGQIVIMSLMTIITASMLGYIPTIQGDQTNVATAVENAKPVFNLPGAIVYDTPGLALSVKSEDTLPGVVKMDPQRKEKCNTCHEGIEPISDNPAMKDLACTFCHGGDPEAITVDEAHVGIVRNPGDMRVVNKTCGICHSNIVENLVKSLHSTMAGKISGARYSAGAQNTKLAIYGVVWVKDTDGDIPESKGALHELKPLPYFDPNKPWSQENHPVDAYLRDQCLRCHIWVRGKEVYADYRSSGCSACHVIYDDDGLYKGGDPTIPKDKPAHMREHRITSKIPAFQCIHCHNRGARTGVSYIGTMEADPYGYPWGTKPGEKAPKLHGKWYNHLLPDIHYERGMQCIDCHVEPEIHGDGNIYSKKWQATAIECETCHGTVDQYANFTTRYGKLPNIVEENGKFYLISKVTGEKHPIPQLKDLAATNQLSPLGYTAMVAVKKHLEKLECYACHAKWAPQCYGCHVQADLSTPDKDWLTYNATAVDDPSMIASQANRLLTTFKVRETRSFLRWDRVPLGIGPEGRVEPYIPGCQDIWTIIGPNGEVIKYNEPFTTYDGYPSVAMAPIQPHTIRPEARTCAECHNDPKAVGLGDEILRYQASNLPLDITKLVDEEGNQLLSINHPNTRPFNKEEIQRILRVGTCIGCHSSYNDPAWSNVREFTGIANNPEAHIEAVNKLFKAALEGTTQQATTTVTKTLTETQTISSIDTTTITETLKAGTNGVIVAGVAIIAVIIGMIVSFILYKRI
ncbi:MAG: cytochrome c3 family protein [Desulfurococcales archaeon]|nr:cytochrome c3 family protein [Desulfurococcales archaeon]